MKKHQRHIILEIWSWAHPDTRKSIFTLQYMADKARVKIDEVTQFISLLEAPENQNKTKKR